MVENGQDADGGATIQLSGDGDDDGGFIDC